MKRTVIVLPIFTFLVTAAGMLLFSHLAKAQTFPLVYAGQLKIAATNVAQCLPTINAQSGVIIKAKTSNTGNGFVGGANVTTTDDGTGTGYRLLPGEAASIAVNATNNFCIAGTQNDVYYYIGN